MKLTPEAIIEASKRVMAPGSSDAERASMVLLKASSDLAQAELIAIFEQAQHDLMQELLRLNANNLVTYHVEAALKRCDAILNRMKKRAIDPCQAIVTSNIITGKLASKKKSGQPLITAFDFISTDTSNIERLVNQMLGSIDHAADTTKSNIKAMFHAVQVSLKFEYQAPQEATLYVPYVDEGTVKSKPVPFKLKRIKKLTPEQQDQIDKDPLKLAKKIRESSYKQIAKMREMYVIGRREADLVRQRTLQAVIHKEATGNAVYKAKQSLVRTLMNDGIVAFVDRSGRKWQLGNYCEMAVRTTSRQSRNFGEIYDDPEHDLYIVVDRKSTCPICHKYEGRVFSRSGMNPYYPPLSDAFGKIDPTKPDSIENTYLSIHPNCRHTLAKWVERAHTPQQIEEMRRKSSPMSNPYDSDNRTDEQIQRYKKREHIMAKEAASKRRYREMLPYVNVGSWVVFNNHYIANDAWYKKKSAEYRQKLKEIATKNTKSP